VGYISIADSGAFVLNQMGWGRQQSVTTTDLDERVLHHMEQEPGTSMRRSPPNTVVRLLHEQLLYPYHLYWVQGLTPADSQNSCVQLMAS
jgi:hypothetical protein